MRKIVVISMITLDGVMQAPGGPEEDPSGGFTYGGWVWPYNDEFSGKVMGEELKEPFDLLLGRKTYDIFASFWPHQDASSNQFAGPFNAATKYVVSDSSPELTWKKSVLIDGEVVQKIKELKQQDGPTLQVHGSGKMVQTLLKYDLVDELRLRIFPITLGLGKRLFEEGTMPFAFELIDSKTSPSGVIFANYKRAGDVRTGSFS